MYKSRKIQIGSSSIGGDAPIRIQSMTTTKTMDTAATVDQCIRIIRSGADFIRLSVRNIKEAEDLKIIQKELREKGFNTPLIADVHFNPEIALVTAGIVDKVRINPGNFANGNIREKLIPLLNCCRKNRTAIRIGINHGSLADHILQKYGNTTEGMIESAMEYLRICRSENFLNVVLSLKSSNTRLVVQSNRLLVKRMEAEGMDFPVHLGVTEAGEGEEGRIRSAVGIGTLLSEGIGDTIRISLTEDPENEIPAARKLLSIQKSRRKKIPESIAWNPYNYSKRKTNEIINIGGKHVPVVISSLPASKNPLNNNDEITADFFYSPAPDFASSFHEKAAFITDLTAWQKYVPGYKNVYPLFNSGEYQKTDQVSTSLNFVRIHPEEIHAKFLNIPGNFDDSVLIFSSQTNKQTELYQAFNALCQSGLPIPVVIQADYSDSNRELYFLKAASDLGVFFLDGLADGLWLNNPNFSPTDNTYLAFQVLQASRARTFRTEYIACPSCGRTLFNIQDTLASVKKHTQHLKHLKIAVMGCIVNGPGEMADADYGFVGSAPGKITLYKEKEAIKKNIPAHYAVGELINLIKDCGDWVEK